MKPIFVSLGMTMTMAFVVGVVALGQAPSRPLTQPAYLQSLHDRALANGGTISIEAPPQRGRARDITQLARGSEQVVVGTAVDANAEVTSNGIGVMTYADVVPSETIKGEPARNVIVGFPAGRVTFADGAVAEIKIPGLVLNPGARYVLFLKKIVAGQHIDSEGADRGAYSLVLVAQGGFEVTASVVRSLARPTYPVFMLYSGHDTAQFLRDVSDAVRR
jgi:hypothetical protein